MMGKTHSELPSPNPASISLALSSEVINTAGRLPLSMDRFAPRFRAEFGCLCLSGSRYY